MEKYMVWKENLYGAPLRLDQYEFLYQHDQVANLLCN